MRSTVRRCLFGVLLLELTGAVRVAQNSEAQKTEDFLFEVQPREIAAGGSAVLRWSIKGATEITIEEAPQSSAANGELHKLGTFQGGSGTLEVKPKENTTYVISCVGTTSYACASLTVRVRVKQR